MDLKLMNKPKPTLSLSEGLGPWDSTNLVTFCDASKSVCPLTTRQPAE